MARLTFEILQSLTQNTTLNAQRKSVQDDCSTFHISSPIYLYLLQFIFPHRIELESHNGTNTGQDDTSSQHHTVLRSLTHCTTVRSNNTRRHRSSRGPRSTQHHIANAARPARRTGSSTRTPTSTCSRRGRCSSTGGSRKCSSKSHTVEGCGEGDRAGGDAKGGESGGGSGEFDGDGFAGLVGEFEGGVYVGLGAGGNNTGCDVRLYAI
ncbi:hypothetical protein G7K_4618-t1 [Saitoella complicata NRRL Y-17804]|uniref:Uncharacterized protein n=1 Tax=Saitoella complicata (strain BCRC 22490 / CBS 7301 / JCM 7358 / NBRC 10748 / NRRL Y-17804) TaxID=698492 RepID=A0A0E9NKY1_SAICN|nr:hypothetical protein G7K_4618-t1 [Saitoella complicata NRRL Y-17804]